ncbi:MAG TPA: hypothetical protein VLC52_09295, partial [Anaerolineae bacterium]|nr:hypothetical protein [Anaerolineae bacterium]
DGQLAGLNSISLTFSEGAQEAYLRSNQGDPTAIGLDNLYREIQVPEGQPGGVPGLRGRWEGADTFVIEEIRTGELYKMRFRATFAGDEVTIVAEDSIFGGTTLESHGRQ